MAGDAAQWAQIIVPGISAAFGGIVTAIVQQQFVASTSRKRVRREKVGEIAKLSVEAEQYFVAEQSLNTQTIQMLAGTRQAGGLPPDVKLPDWVRLSKELPHKTPELENLVRTFLPQQADAILDIRRLEGELQQIFATIYTEVLQAEPSAIDVHGIGVRCVTETLPIVEKIKRSHNLLSKVASATEQPYV